MVMLCQQQQETDVRGHKEVDYAGMWPVLLSSVDNYYLN